VSIVADTEASAEAITHSDEQITGRTKQHAKEFDSESEATTHSDGQSAERKKKHTKDLDSESSNMADIKASTDPATKSDNQRTRREKKHTMSGALVSDDQGAAERDAQNAGRKKEHAMKRKTLSYDQGAELDSEVSIVADTEASAEAITHSDEQITGRSKQRAKDLDSESSSMADIEASTDLATKSNDHSTGRKKKHALKRTTKQHVTHLDVAVQAAEATTEAVASLEDIKDQKGGSLRDLQAQTERLTTALDAAEEATAALNGQAQIGIDENRGQQDQSQHLVKQQHLPLLERTGTSSAIKEAFQMEQEQHMHLEQQRRARDQLLEAQQARVQHQVANEQIEDQEWKKEQDWFEQHLMPKTTRHPRQHGV